MKDTVSRQLALSDANRQFRGVNAVLTAITDRMASRAFSAGGLAIKTSGSALAKTVNTVYYIANGVYGSLSAGDMPALTGLNISAGKYNVAVFYVDVAGTVTAVFGTEGATAAAVTFPEAPQGKAAIGFLMITYASAFTGGTTPLDTATTVYVDVTGAFDPTIKL